MINIFINKIGIEYQISWDLASCLIAEIARKTPKKLLGHLLLRLLVLSHRSLIRLLRTAQLARTLPCANSLTCSEAHEKDVHVDELNALISYSLNP